MGDLPEDLVSGSVAEGVVDRRSRSIMTTAASVPPRRTRRAVAAYRASNPRRLWSPVIASWVVSSCSSLARQTIRTRRKQAIGAHHAIAT